MEYCCLSDGNCCKYVLRVELARTPDKAGSLALRRKQERLGRSDFGALHQSFEMPFGLRKE